MQTKLFLETVQLIQTLKFIQTVHAVDLECTICRNSTNS